MMQIVLFLIFILLLLLVFVAKKDSLSTNNKITLVITSAVVLIAIGIYQSSISSQSEHNRIILNAYEQGQSLQCGEYSVDKERFLYVSGTQDFMGKKEHVNLRGVIVNASECSVQK